MNPRQMKHITELIGHTPVIRVNSLSDLTGCDILLKLENTNPGGSVKDRAALQMILDAIESGELKKGMTIVEGTAGNTGIGLALVGRSLGFDVRVVMPKGQAFEKERLVGLYGAELKLVDPCPFSKPGHFYHTARRIAEENPKRYWWANQFENLSNYKAHYSQTGPEILTQTDNDLDFFVSVAGTGGTIGGVSSFIKENNTQTKIVLADPQGSGLRAYVHTGEFKNEGSSITEGIGIMRLVKNFARAKVDYAFTIPDPDLIAIANYVKDKDSIVVGSSSALNLAGALKVALTVGKGHKILTLLCDAGERSISKLYNTEFLDKKGLNAGQIGVETDLLEKYRKETAWYSVL